MFSCRQYSPVDYQTCVLEGRGGRVALDHFGQHGRTWAGRQGRSHLGREWYERVSWINWTGTSTTGRSWTRVRLPMASLGCQVRRLWDRLHGSGCGSAVQTDRNDSHESVWSTIDFVTMECIGCVRNCLGVNWLSLLTNYVYFKIWIRWPFHLAIVCVSFMWKRVNCPVICINDRETW